MLNSFLMMTFGVDVFGFVNRDMYGVRLGYGVGYLLYDLNMIRLLDFIGHTLFNGYFDFLLDVLGYWDFDFDLVGYPHYDWMRYRYGHVMRDFNRYLLVDWHFN
jgi:hypothetical protein